MLTLLIGQHHEQKRTARRKKSMKELNILVVDDNPHIQGILPDLIGHCFQEMGFKEPHVIVRNDLDSSLFLITKSIEPFDLIITDFEIPTGHEGRLIASTARDVAKQKGGRSYIIGMSGMDDGELKLRTVNWQIDRFIKKPFTYQDVSEALQAVMDTEKDRTALAA